MSYFASKVSSYISLIIVIIGAIVSAVSPFQHLIPGKYGVDLGNAILLLGAIKASLSGSILPAIKSLVATPPTPAASPVAAPPSVVDTPKPAAPPTPPAEDTYPDAN